eukprot:gene36791-44631_t
MSFLTTGFVLGSRLHVPQNELVTESERRRNLLKPKTIFETISGNIYVLAFVAYGSWVWAGVLFYTYYNKFTMPTAFFYAMEAGLSVGFCNPTEINDRSRVFTIFYVLSGGVLISGVLAVFATSLLGRRAILVPVGHKFGAVSTFDGEGKITLKTFFSSLWYHMKYLSGWYTSRPRTILTFSYIIWVVLGTLYGIRYENWSVITSLYFTIITLSTGGLQSPPCLYGTTGNTCNMGDFRGSIMGAYMMLGIPLYAATLAEWAQLAVAKALRKREQDLLNTPIEDAEFLFAANILSPQGSETLVLGEYILLELMRLGLTNQAQIESIKRKFYDLDKQRCGELDINDLREAGVVVPRKLHSVDSDKSGRNGGDLLDNILQIITSLSPHKRRSSLEAAAEYERMTGAVTKGAFQKRGSLLPASSLLVSSAVDETTAAAADDEEQQAVLDTPQKVTLSSLELSPLDGSGSYREEARQVGPATERKAMD